MFRWLRRLLQTLPCKKLGAFFVRSGKRRAKPNAAPMEHAGVIPSRKALGHLGEEIASSYLQSHGYQILARNVVCRQGELDLVARDGDWLVFVEVRSRRGLAAVEIAESITPEKQRRLIRAAQHFRRTHRVGRMPCRFDVITISFANEGEDYQLHHYRSAFQPDDV